MDMRGDPQGCSGDFSATSPLSLRHDRSAPRAIPTEKTGRQKSASHHPYLSEDNTRNGAAPVPPGSVSPRCLLRVRFLLFVCSRENSISAMHHFLCPPKMQWWPAPQQRWPGRTFPRAAPDMYLLSMSYALAPPGRRRAGLMAPEERKSRWSQGGQDYEVLESRGWHGKRGRKSLLCLLMLPPPDAHGSAVPWREKAAAATAPADAREGQKHEC